MQPLYKLKQLLEDHQDEIAELITIACGNSFILKSSEKVPLTMMKVFEVIDQLDLPPGPVNLVHGGKESVDALLDHVEVKIKPPDSEWMKELKWDP